jgi:hypothetical protein
LLPFRFRFSPQHFILYHPHFCSSLTTRDHFSQPCKKRVKL